MPWDPFKDGQANEVNPAPQDDAGFDPFAAGLADPANERGTLSNSWNRFAQGALADGIYAGYQGGAGLVQAAQADAVKRPELGQQLDQLQAQRTEIMQGRRGPDGEPMMSRNPVRLERLQQLEDVQIPAARAAVTQDLNERLAAAPAAGLVRTLGEARQGVREVFPVDQSFDESTLGQVIGAVGQMTYSMPFYAVPLAGPGMTIGQMYQQGVDDATARGADPGTAMKAGLANVPAAALEYAADRLQIDTALRALKGAKVKQVLARLVANAGAEAGTEGGQQAWQNLVAQSLVGYDPERTIDDGVLQSMKVGFLAGGVASAGGQALGAMAGKSTATATDTGTNVPESPATLEAQREQVLAGLKPAVMFPAGTGAEPALPAGLQRVETPRGVFHFDPAQVSAEQILEASAAGRENEVLGLGPVSKPEVQARAAAGDPAMAVTERTPEGLEVKAAVANASNADVVAASLEAGKTPGNVVAAEPVEQVVAARRGVGPVVLDIPEAPGGIEGDDRAVYDRFRAQLLADPAAAIEAYRAANLRGGLLTIDTDQARELSSDYAVSNETRNRLAPVVHEPSSSLAKAVYEDALARPVERGAVLFLAGGGGAGKTSAKDAVLGEIAQQADMVVDGTFSNLESSARKIEQALRSGRQADVAFVYAPARKAWQQVEQRRMRNGRRVPFAAFKKAHDEALVNVMRLRERFARDARVSFTFVDNSGTLNDVAVVPWDVVLRKATIAGSVDASTAARLTREIEDETAQTIGGIAARGSRGGGRAPGETGGGGSQGNPRQRGGPAAGRGTQEASGGQTRPAAGELAALNAWDARTPDGAATVAGRWRLVEARNLVTSQDQGFDGRLQPRDRSRAASEQQIQKIVTGFDAPRLGDSLTSDLGAPFVDGRRQVLSGNGRVLALREVFQVPDKAAQYLRWLDGVAPTLGLDPEQAQGMREPVLVRQVDDFGGLDPVDFARRSNQAQVLGMSESEQAGADAALIAGNPTLARSFRPSPEGDVMAESNREFLANFADATGARAELVAKDGRSWSGRMATRVRNAVMAAVLGPERRGLLDRLVEQPEGIKRVVNAVLAESGRLLPLQGTPYDLGPALGKALEDLVSVRQGGGTVADYLAQVDFVNDGGRTAESDAVLQAFDSLKSTKRVGEFLAAYADGAAQQDTGTEVMFAGAEPAAVGQLLERAARVARGEGEPSLQFARRRQDPGVDPAQSDLFAGGQTGGDTLFNLQGETRDAATAAWSMDEEMARREAAAREADAQGGFDFASRSAPASTVVRRRLASRQAQWRANAQRVAPGLMQRFGIEFGSPEALVAKGKVDRRDLDGSQQAAYDAQERIFYLFDQALQANSELGTTINLLHEMGHAHWDTLPATRRAELVERWAAEVSARKGPLYVKGKLRGGVARGVEASVKEWYAERVAFANSDWARGRIEAGGHGSLIKEAAAGLRRLLERMQVWLARLRGDAGGRVDVDFRAFLDAGPERFASAPAVEFASRPTGAPAPIGYSRNWQQAARSWVRKWFTSAGNLPKGVLELRMQRDGRLAAIAKQVEFALRDLDRAVIDVYGGFGAVPAGELARLNEVLGGTLSASQAGLDPRVARAIEPMRRQIDVMSRRLVHEGVIAGNVAARVAGNVGFYLNRSYRKFDDKKWAARVPVQVRNRAASFIRAQLQAQNPVLPVDEREVQGYLDYLLSKDVNEAGQFFRAPSRDGAKDLRVLTPRQEIPVELRELLGEYKDPRVNFVRSVAKTAQLVENHRYLELLRSGGIGKWLVDRPGAGATGSYSVPVAAGGSETLAPLDGTYTTPEIAAALQDQFGGRSESIAWQAWLAINGWAKVAKTVYSPVTQTRNFLGNLGFMVANGHWRANNAPKVWQAMRSELGLGRAGDTPAARAYVSKLTRLGILGQSVNAGELREALRDAGARMAETGNLEKWLEGRLVRAAKLPFRLAARLYQANDEIFKIYAFENEMAQWRAAMPAAPVDQVEQIAAERVRNTLPTYSLIPRAVQSVRRVALTGSFVSFPAEVVRTGYHTIRYALQDLQSSNPAVRGMGAKRLAGLVAVASLPAAVSMTSRWLANLDAEDEEDLRRFLPEWSANSALIYQGNPKPGRYRLVDASYLDPWNYLKKPITALLRGEDVGAGLRAAMLEAAAPVASEGLMTKVVLDLGRNRQPNGAPIWNEQAPILEKLQAQAAHVGKALEPGLVTQARRMRLAAAGKVSDTGRAYVLEDEVQAVLTGARSLSVDVGQGLLFRAKTFEREKALAEQLYTSVKYSRGEVDGAEIQEARAKMEAARRVVYDRLAADVAAAQRLGVPAGEILQGLLGAGVSRADAAAALAGFVPDYLERAPSKTRVLQDLLMTRE